ncbi:hypothetical protein LJC42_03240 [Eubacteriales bacterium OttesenSCG-928-K08]|nr:hypothetical protein [Eubacteriales bacterium OttesenSCG-928-K08]
MNDNEKKIVKTLIDSRYTVALERLKENPQYAKVCQQQEVSGEAADTLLHKLEKDERITVRRHFEGETHKTGFELDAVYLQGISDCLRALVFLAVFERGSGL